MRKMLNNVLQCVYVISRVHGARSLTERMLYPDPAQA